MKGKQSRFRTLHEIYVETASDTYIMKEVEKLSKETQDLNKKVNRKNGEESSSKQKGQNVEGLIESKRVQKAPTFSSQFGKKLPFQTGQEAEKDNCIGNGYKMVSSTNREKGKLLPQFANQKREQTGLRTMRRVLPTKAATSSEVERQQAVKFNDHLVPVIENDNERCERRHNKPASNSKKTISAEKMIISKLGAKFQQSGKNKLLMENIRDTTGGTSSMQRGIGNPINDMTIALEATHTFENAPDTGNMGGSRPATRTVEITEKGFAGKMVSCNVSDGTVAVNSPSSGISTNSNAAVILKNVELQAQDMVSKISLNSIHESTGPPPSSTGKRKESFWSMDFDLNTTKSTKAVKTCLIPNNYGSEDKIQMDAPVGLHSSSDGFKSSVISNQHSSPKERDFLSSFGLGTSEHSSRTHGADAPYINNNFSCKMSLSAVPTVPKEKDSLNSIGAHGGSGFRLPPPPVTAPNMNIMDIDRIPGFVQHQVTNTFTVSGRSSFAPYNRQTVASNNNNNTTRPLSSTHTLAVTSGRTGLYDGTPFNSQGIRLNSTSSINNSGVIPASSIVPNISAPSSSSGPAVVYWAIIRFPFF